jgi:polysaccharide export outer membrane protein
MSLKLILFKFGRQNDHLIFSFALLSLVIVLCGCPSAKQQKMDRILAQSHSDRTVKEGSIDDLNAKLLIGADRRHDPGDYILGPGDLLQVTVFEAKELAATVRVSSRGYITLPLLGQVNIKGLSAREAEIHIEGRYRENYIKDPHVSIFVEEHHSQRVTLIGQFQKPGTYDYPTKQKLLDVMALGNGLTENAGRTAQVRRHDGEPGRESGETIIIDLDRLIREGEGELNIDINGGDVVFVPEAGTFFITGAVRNPGAYPIRQRTLLMEAIAAAGGLAPYADADRLLLVRHVGNGDREIKELDLDEIVAQEFVINDRDVIFARASAWGKLMHGFNIRLGVPGAGVGYADPER